MVAKRDGKLTSTKADKAFLESGFSNWKDATAGFKSHEKTECHQAAVERVVTLPKVTKDVGEMLSVSHANDKEVNRQCLLNVLSSIRFIARQGLALRGDGDDSESNYIQLLKLRGEDDSKILDWIKRKNDKYTCAESQNEMLKIMALSILRDVAQNIKNSVFYSIMADETTDKSNREQIVLVIRHVNENLEPQEEFIGLTKVPSIDADTLTKTIEDCLLRMNLSLNNCRGQCYDGASNMSGAKKGVATQINEKEPRAVYTHCYGHALNLAVGDTVKQSKTMRDALDTTHEISKLLKYSPKRDSLFEKLKQELAPETPGFRTLCPTRWTVRAASLKSVVDNYIVLQDLWDECDSKDSEIRARILGVSAQMRTFEYLFGVMLPHEILSLTDNLSKSLQQESLSASEGQRLAKRTLDSLVNLRSDDSFDSFWTTVQSQSDRVDVNEPVVPRRRKAPKRYETGDGIGYHPETVQTVFRPKYFEAIDLAMASVKDRFDQPGYRVLQNVEDLLIKSAQPIRTEFTEELDFVCEFYGSDVNRDRLEAQLQVLRAHFVNAEQGKVALADVMKFLSDQSVPERALFSEVVVLLKILLVMPATNATSERTFSALRRIKTYLRSTMTQVRLNNLMMLHIHKDKTDSLDLCAIADEFATTKERRRCVFGKFK